MPVAMPPESRRRRVSVRLSPALEDDARRVAADSGVTFTELVETALADQLQRQKAAAA